MTNSILSLPIPLILLVHLHILEYPHTNKPEYDHNIFDAHTRGLRERTKLMEDVSYFLVGRLEGGKDGARAVLSTYPCVQPSDSVAFRTSLSKYLEALRHKSLYPSSSKPLGASGKGKAKDAASEAGAPVAWWWKEVVVRKSLLEECTGEKFERLLLSLSTHALLKKSALEVIPENAINLLRVQPFVYTDFLSKRQSTRHLWTRSASLLLKQQEDLKSLRATLSLPKNTLGSKYDSLSTERLLALAQSKLQDLLQHSWRGKEGQQALQFIADAAGVKTVIPSSTETILMKDADGGQAKDVKVKIPPQPLPVAAAHHPSHLRKLRRPLFPQEKPKPPAAESSSKNAPARPSSKSHAEIALSDRLDREKKMHQALGATLSRTRNRGEELAEQMRILLESRKEKSSVNAGPKLELWMPELPSKDRINYDTHVNPELLATLSLSIPEVEGALEARIDYIRESLLPPYPPIIDPAARPPPEEPPVTDTASSSLIPKLQTRIPRAHPTLTSNPPPNSLSGHAIEEEAASGPSYTTPTFLDFSPPRALITSTPPPTVKPRSAQLQGIMSTQKSGRRNSRMPRKSIRFSLAVTRRPSLFPAPGGEGEEVEDEVSRIIYGTRDTSDTEDPSFSATTPRAKPKPVNRIYTAGTPCPKSSSKKPKHSYPMALLEPAMPLPSLVSASSSFSNLMGEEGDDPWVSEGNDPWMSDGEAGDIQEKENGGDGDVSWNEAPSMTLRDILLKTDTTQFDLLDDGPEDDVLEDESFEWE